MDRLMHDLRHAIRQWRRTPVVTAIALLSLALGIGANLALFGLVDALLLRSLPVRDPGSLIRVVSEEPRLGLTVADISVSTPVWEHLRAEQSFADSVFAVSADRLNLARGGEVRYASALYVSGNALEVLGVVPAMGRGLQPDDDRANAAPVAMISHGLWQREFGSDPDVLGDELWLDNHVFTIVGVTPAAFFGLEVGRRADVIVPLATRGLIRGQAEAASSVWLTVYGRLRPGETVDDASAALRAWSPALREATLPAGPAAERHLTTPLFAVSGAQGLSFLRKQYQEPLLVLLVAVGLVLLIACANLSALVLARFTDRRHELGVRLALGASRGRLVRTLLAESLVLAAAGTILGVWLSHWAVAAVVPYLTHPVLRGLAPALPVSIDPRLLLVAALLTILCGAVAGLLPAWRATRVSAQVSLATSTRGGLEGARSARAMRVMVAAQVALSLVLVMGAALMVRSFVALTTGPTGVDPDRVLVAAISGEVSTSARTPFERVDTIRRALAALPGVEAASAGVITPLSGAMAAAWLEVPGSRYEPPPGRPQGAAPFNSVLPDFFRVVGTPLLSGRGFDERDIARAHGVAIVNKAFSRQHFRQESPLGRIIMIGGAELEIVGMVADSRQISLKEERVVPMAFGLLTQRTPIRVIPNLRFVVRTDHPDAMRGPVIAALRAIDPQLNVEFRTMRDEADASVNRERILAWLGGLFATLGLAMAMIGLYGTFTYAVVRRRGEIGVRMAIGAARADVFRMVMRDAGVVLAIGSVLGVAGAVATSRLVQSLLFGIDARDPWTLAVAVTAVLIAAAVASIVPARNAARTEPMAALRDE